MLRKKQPNKALHSDKIKLRSSLTSLYFAGELGRSAITTKKTKTRWRIKMGTTKEKSLALAIGLNLLLPGLGYMYMGKVVLGILAILLIIGIYATTAVLFLAPTWIVMNIIMAIDMIILNSKNKKMLVEQNTKKCPNCAELIQKEAKICRFCNTKFNGAAAS